MWFEELPKECPPANAIEPNGVYYRFVKSDVISDDDFISLKMQNPSKNYGPLECQARAISLEKNIESCTQTIKRLPKFKKSRIAKVQLVPTDGLVLNTPSTQNQNHLSWWRANSFQISQSSIIA